MTPTHNVQTRLAPSCALVIQDSLVVDLTVQVQYFDMHISAVVRQAILEMVLIALVSSTDFEHH